MMEKHLDEREIQFAKKIINISLANAANSFSKLAGEKVCLQEVYIPPLTPDNDLNHVINSEENLYVLHTEIKGELPAESYLIFTPANALSIVSLITGTKPETSEYKEAVLLEADNILTASVVTQFSNFFNVAIYGDVPALERRTKSKTEEILSSKMNQYGIRVSFKTCFITKKLKIYPEFIWIFTTDFIDAVKSFAKKEEACSAFNEFEDYLKEYVH